MVHMVYQINEWSLQLTDDRGLRCQHVLGGVPGKARALPAQSSKPRSWQSRAPMVLGLQGHTGLCWAGKEQMENGTLWPGEVFSFCCLSLLHQDVSCPPWSSPGACP